VVSFTTLPLYPQEKSPRTGLDDVERRKILLLPDSNSGPSSVQPVATQYTDCAIPDSSSVNTVTDLINALPGNGYVITAQNATIDEAVFYMSSAPRPVIVGDQ
jgi:hypothetical protein